MELPDATNRDLKMLKRAGVFHELSEEDLMTVSQHFRWEEYNSAKHVIHNGDKSTNVFVIVSGSVKVVRFSGNGKEVTYRDITPVEIFGDLGVLTGSKRVADVVTTEPSLIGSIDGTLFLTLLETYPILAHAHMAKLSAAIQNLTDQIFAFATLNVKTRLLIYILRLAQAAASPDANTCNIDPAPSHYEIATRINTHREAVTRNLNLLAKAGLLRLSRNRIDVLDLERLSSMSTTALLEA